MLQVATFLVPQQQDEANEFLKAHKTQNQSFNKDTIIIFYDDGVYAPEEQIADIQELITANKKGRFQFEVSLHMMKADLADLKPGTKNWQDLSSAITETERQLTQHDMKRAFAEQRIAEIKKEHGIN